MKNKHKIIFILIFLLSLISRLWKLASFPISLNWDEISHGYNAYSLLKTGQDQWSKPWPIFNFRAYGDYPTTLNMYLSILPIALFGLNPWSVRIVSALCGIGTVLTSYFLGKQLFKNRKSSLLLMFLVSISPWTFFPSRAVFQSTVAQFFLQLGILFLLKSVKKIKNFPIGLFFSAISTYAYHNTRIIAPLLVFTFVIIYFNKLKSQLLRNKKLFFLILVIVLFLLIPQTVNIFQKEAQARSRWVFIINPNSIYQIEEKRNTFQGSPLVAKLIYNRYSLFFSTVLKNYLGFINPKILFFDSTQNHQFNIPKTGILYLTTLPFFYLGFLHYIKKSFKGDCLSIFILAWFILGLIPAVITTGDFPIIRAVTILPVPFIFVSQSFFTLLSKISLNKYRQLLTVLFIFILLFHFVLYLNKYFKQYSIDQAYSWQYGYKQAVNYIKNNYNNFDQIVFTKKYGEPHEFILFYWPWPPSDYQNDPNKIWDYHDNWYWVDSFDKFLFVNDWEIKELLLNSKTLLITSPNNYPVQGKIIETIYYPNNQPIFDIVLYE